MDIYSRHAETGFTGVDIPASRDILVVGDSKYLPTESLGAALTCLR